MVYRLTTKLEWFYECLKNRRAIRKWSHSVLCDEERQGTVWGGCFNEARRSNSEVPKHGYDNIDETRQAVSAYAYIRAYYQNVSSHSFNDYLIPFEKERLYFNQNLFNTV